MVAYWIAHVDVSDPEAYEAYRKANALAFNKYNGRAEGPSHLASSGFKCDSKNNPAILFDMPAFAKSNNTSF